MEKESFAFKKAWRDAVCELPEKVRAEVYAAIIEYGLTGEAPKLKSMGRIAFAFVKADIDRDNAAATEHEKKSDRMRRLASKRWDKEHAAHADAYADAHAKTNPAYADAYAKRKAGNPRVRVYKTQDNKDENINLRDNIKKEKESVEKKNETQRTQKSTQSAIEKRKEDFYESLVPYVARYGREMIRAFYDYWSETNRSVTKMRYELERTWQTSRRLATWASRDNHFKKTTYGTDRQNHQESAQQRADDALAIMQELKAEGNAADAMADD